MLETCAVDVRVWHLEYFFDHERIERMIFDSFPEPVNGALAPDLSRPGNGFVFRVRHAERFFLR